MLPAVSLAISTDQAATLASSNCTDTDQATKESAVDHHKDTAAKESAAAGLGEKESGAAPHKGKGNVAAKTSCNPCVITASGTEKESRISFSAQHGNPHIV